MRNRTQPASTLSSSNAGLSRTQILWPDWIHLRRPLLLRAARLRSGSLLFDPTGIRSPPSGHVPSSARAYPLRPDRNTPTLDSSGRNGSVSKINEDARIGPYSEAKILGQRSPMNGLLKLILFTTDAHAVFSSSTAGNSRHPAVCAMSYPRVRLISPNK